MTTNALDLDRLLKFRLVVARFGEMELAKWWITKGQLGQLGASDLRRGFPRTHRFAQARLGDMSVQGNIKPLRSLTEPLRVAKDNGAKRALIPIENKRNFLDVSADIMEHVGPIFFSDPKTAPMKVMGG